MLMPSEHCCGVAVQCHSVASEHCWLKVDNSGCLSSKESERWNGPQILSIAGVWTENGVQ